MTILKITIQNFKNILLGIFSAGVAFVVVESVFMTAVNSNVFNKVFQVVVFPLSTFKIGGNGHPAAELLFLILLPISVLFWSTVFLGKNIYSARKLGPIPRSRLVLFYILLVSLVFGVVIGLFNLPDSSGGYIFELLSVAFWATYFAVLYYIFFFTLYAIYYIIYNKIHGGNVKLLPVGTFIRSNIFSIHFATAAAILVIPLVPVIFLMMEVSSYRL